MGNEPARPGAATSERFAAASPGHDHVVTFYDEDRFLVASVAEFVRPALERGDKVVVVATSEHRDAIATTLAAAPGLTAADVAGRVVFLEAQETLDVISPGGTLDQERFGAFLGAVIDGVLAGQDGVRIFGEMVALLWAAGDVAGAIELEDLWNELLDHHPFALLCAYPSAGFDGPTHGDGFRAVCERHGEVIPSDRSSELAGGSAVGAIVAHELGSPAAVLRGVLDQLRSGWPQLDETSITEFLDLADANVARIVRLADDVLMLGRLETGAFSYDIRELDLATVVDRSVREIRTSTGRRVDLHLADGLPRVLADPDRQTQVLHNLLGNAVKYSPASSVVTVEIASDTAGGLVQVRVRDQGAGIAPADLGRLFQPFTRFDGPHGPNGTGLGLYIARALVEGQGGTIGVDSVEGHGSTFSYTVPVAPPG